MDTMCLDVDALKSELVDTSNESMSDFNYTEELMNVTCLENDIFNEDIEWNETTWVEDGNGLSPFESSSQIKGNYEAPKPKIIKDFVSEIDDFDEIFEEENNDFYGLSNEVGELIKQARNISNLYDWQHECLSLNAIKKRRNLIYTLPTSGGKTLVAEILMLKELLCNKKNVIFILPFVAIVQEKIQSMTPFALDLGFLIEEYAGGKGQYPPVKRRRKNTIYICTIEKASGLVNSLMEVGRLSEIGLVVVDELHLIGENGGRGATLEGLLTKLIYSSKHIQIVGMSATIGNLEEIAQFLNADLYAKNFRPVQLKEFVKCSDSLWEIDPRQEDLFINEKKISYPYSDSARQVDPDRIGGLVMDVLPQHSCLIFCATRKNCENLALLLTRVLLKTLITHKMEERKKLLTDLRTEDALCPILFKTIKYGVAYHHSGLTNEERRLIEDAFREGVISVICCTSTLAAGVNLPARRVIIRSPYIGSEFLNLSKYKQMIGRAGRAGMGEIGESIVVCQPSDVPKIRELLMSKIDNCVSTLSVEEDRGIHNLILSSVMLSLATTRNELQTLIQSSLLNVQASKLNINVKEVTDNAVIKLIKAQVLKVKHKPCSRANTTVNIQSQMSEESNQGKQSLVITAASELELSTLGKAAMKGCLDLELAKILYRDLKTAQKHLILDNTLHLLYLVTPYELANQLKPNGSVYYDAVMSLSLAQMDVARVLGINEVTIMKIRDEKIPKNVEQRVLNRFYLTLILHEMWQNQSMYMVAEKYQVNRGLIQNLLTSAASFAMAIVRLCQELPEFWVFTDLFTSLHKKLIYSNSTELESLIELPAVKLGRAKQLYNAGYKTLQSIASANPGELQRNVKNLSKKIATQMVDAANLLLLEKMENLKEEVAEMMEGLNTYQRLTQKSVE